MSVGRGNDRTELPKRGKTSKPAQSTAGTGYGRPPEHARFKPGKSGNPKGRPKQSKNLKSIIQQALTSNVTVRENGRLRSVSKIEGVVLSQLERALKGNEKAALAVLRMAGHVDLLNGSDGSTDGDQLSPADEKILAQLLAGQKPAKRRG
jgi:Family of unknown function (DUF5681)